MNSHGSSRTILTQTVPSSVVHNERIQGRVRQRVIATLGRLGVLKETGQLDGLLESLARLSDHVGVLNCAQEQ